MTPEIVQKLSIDEYHARKDFVSSTLIREFLRSPAHLQAYLRNPPDQTKAQLNGDMGHTAILEPELLTKKFIAGPDGNWTLKENKDAVAKLRSEHPDKTVVKADELKALERMVESVYSHDAASASLTGGVAEQSIFWLDKESEVKCKCRPDYYIQSGGILVDVKTTEDARLSTFQKSLFNFGYYRQLAFYGLGLKAAGLPVEKFRIIAVEKADPFAVSVFDVDSVSINRGIQEVWKALKQYRECLRSDVWPAYPDGISVISLPSWAF